MSRTSNRGPRADIALLRKLKADPNFSPASLLNTGPNILDKANKLKGFVENQRGKLGAAAAKTEWLLQYQQLQSEQDDAERELAACLQQLSEQPGAGQLREVAEVGLVTLYDQAEACRAERQRLRSQVEGLSSVHASLKAYGRPVEFSREAAALQGELSATSEELEAELARAAEQLAALTSESRELWPSALGTGFGAGDGGGGGGLAAVARGDAGDACPGAAAVESAAAAAQLQPVGYSRREEDAEELERMLSRYPLASPDIKDRIREVFEALRDKYLEKLETWRVEAEQTACDLLNTISAAASTSSPASGPSTNPSRRIPQNKGAAVVKSGQAAGGSCGGGGRAAAGRPAAGLGTAARSGRGRGQGTAAAGGDGSPPPPQAGRAASRIPPPPPAAERAAAAAAAAGGGRVLDGGGGVVEEPAGAAGSSWVTENADNNGASVGGGGGGGGDSGVSWLLGGYGAWSAEEHSAFVRQRDRLMKECGQGLKSLSREVLMSRIATLLPGRRTVSELLAHDDWTIASRLVGRRRRDLSEAWDRERRLFLEDSASFLQESQTLFLVQAEEAADRLVAELQRVRARDELEELRAEKAREEEEAAAERAVRQAAEAEAKLQAEARLQRERAIKKDMVAAYRAELERQQAEQQAVAAEAQRQAALISEQQAVYNKERVEVRQAEYLVRQEQAKERQAAVEAEALAREARLARLRALVAPDAESDPERLLAPTAASAAVDPHRGAEGAFQPVNGYTTEQVVKDQRFKVFEALAVLGLHETSYGRQAIAAAKPARLPRPDNFTSEQREAMMRR